MYNQLETTLVSIQLITMALVLLSCLLASAVAALICILSTWRKTDDRVRVLVKGPTQGGHSTGRSENPDLFQG